MPHWTWWQSGLALAGVAFFHWLWTRRMLAVSGAMTSLVNRVRFGPEEEVPALSMEQMVAALKDATAREFGAAAADAPAVTAAGGEPVPVISGSRPPSTHLLLLGGLVLGGFVAAVSGGSFAVTSTLNSELFGRLTGSPSAVGPAVLVLGGMLVGFGTRMAGGCTSGHGLCGVSRVQTGSLAATATFFGAGVAVSLLIARLW
jgi:hypothetical protein